MPLADPLGPISLGSAAAELNALKNMFASSIDCKNLELMSIGYATNIEQVFPR